LAFEADPTVETQSDQNYCTADEDLKELKRSSYLHRASSRVEGKEEEEVASS